MHLTKYLSNLPGWRTNRKLVIIESDDWGSIRMPSLRVNENLDRLGLKLDNNKDKPYNKLDTLENKLDFEALFETLSKFKDYKGNHPIITALALTSNPDFEKIRTDNFEKYYYKNIDQTYADYAHGNVLEYWKQGEDHKLFTPEFHGREHLNVNLWMHALQANDEETLLAFHHHLWGFKPKYYKDKAYQSAFDFIEIKDIKDHKAIISDGIKQFELLHKKKPKFFVPPNGAIHQDVIDHSASLGLKYISTPKIHAQPVGHGKTKKKFRYLGKKGKNGQVYITRNCVFEPSYACEGHDVESCLEQLETAFLLKKPAVICSHRLNYVGGLNENNRKKGNEALKSLLTTILKKWPDVEFMTSVQLGELIQHDKK